MKINCSLSAYQSAVKGTEAPAEEKRIFDNSTLLLFRIFNIYVLLFNKKFRNSYKCLHGFVYDLYKGENSQ